MKHLYRLTKKFTTMRTFTLFLLSLSYLSLVAQEDDVYYSPKHDGFVAEANIPEQKSDAQNYDYEDGEVYSDYYDDGYYSNTDTKTDASGDTYITNNYYGDNYGSDYTTRLNRFYSPYIGFGYYSPCYSSNYYNPYYGYGSGWSASVSWGYSWGYPSSWGYYDPWYSPYYPSYYRYGGYHHGHGYGHGYNHGYNDGYWNGYYDGSYGYGSYPYNNYSSYNSNYHYGPRYKTQGVSSNRNTHAEKKAPEVVEKRSNDINTFPVGENKDVWKPVRIDNPTQISSQNDKNNIESVNERRIENNGSINKGEIKPVSQDAVKKQNTGRIEKGAIKPINNQSAVQKDSRNAYIEKYNVKTPNTQRNDNSRPSQKPTTVTPRNETPVNRGQTFPKSRNNEKTNTERQVSPRNSGYQKPQRENNYQRSKDNQTVPRSTNYQRNEKPQYENKGNAPNHKPRRGYTPKSNRTPSRDVSPKSYDRGGSYQKPKQRSSGFNRSGSTPVHSNRGSYGGGKSSQQAPSKSGRVAPR